MFRELITYMMEDPRNITPCTHLLFIAKNLERIGDHATNIAETVYYAVKGEVLPGCRGRRAIPRPMLWCGRKSNVTRSRMHTGETSMLDGVSSLPKPLVLVVEDEARARHDAALQSGEAGLSRRGSRATGRKR